MKTNPPAADDAPMVAKLAKIGIVPGRTSTPPSSIPAVAKGIAAAPKPAQEKIMGWLKEASSPATSSSRTAGVFTTKTGIYGTDYLQRALITGIGLGANRPQDAVYPTSEGPDSMQEVQRRQQVRRCTSTRASCRRRRLLVAHDVRRRVLLRRQPAQPLHVSSRNKFKTNADGSVDLYIQNESPGKDKEANWLPAPKDKFVLMMRLYWPKEKPPSILDGSWKPPHVAEVK